MFRHLWRREKIADLPMQKLDYPDAWSVMKITYIDEDGLEDVQFRLVCGWIGGFFKSDEWRVNSGIVSADLKDGVYAFLGKSGSTYHCDRRGYRVISIMHDGIRQIERMGDVVSVEIMADCDWQNVKFDHVRAL